ncbi:hypothetical protein Terranova_207 [Staphylococcus phage Terranova]|nr:hypothetical protein Terranova_207 [Staphylococcus phage Terranova]
MKYWNKNNVFYAETKQGEINYIDLSDTHKRGKQIDWKNISNELIKFRYMDVEDTLILNFNNGKCILEYKGNVVHMQVTNIKRVKLNQLINQTKVRAFQDFNEGDMVKGCEILKVKKVNDKVYYLVYNVKEEVSGVIENQKLRDIKTGNYLPQGTVPVSRMLFNHEYVRDKVKNKNDLYSNKDTSRKYINIKCPHCHKEQRVRINDLVKPTFTCICSKQKTSFPERFVQATLDTLNIQYKREVKVKELELRRFDFYLPEKDIFIEVNGEQHYKPNKFMDYETTIKSDKAKELYCKRNNKKLIIIDARKSTYNWMIKQISKYVQIDRDKVIKQYNREYR